VVAGLFVVEEQTRATELRRALAAYTNQGNKQFVPFSQGLLAAIEAPDDAEGALTRIDEGLALAGETAEHWSDAFLHRLRGEILLKRGPANTALAEDACSLQLPSRKSRRRAVLSCAQLSIWHDFIIARAVPRNRNFRGPEGRVRDRVARRGQLDIDRGQQLGVEQSAMFAAQ
jgi:hypothetical protein